MINPTQIEQFQEILSRSQNILVTFLPTAQTDMLASATAIYLGLKTLEGKQVTLLCPQQLDSSQNSLAGLNEAQDQIGNKNLQVSFPYDQNQIDKVGYDIDEEENRFYLLIQPQKGSKPLDYKQVEFALVGVEADLIITVGVNQLESLEQLYVGYESLYQDAAVVSLHNFEPSFGNVKLSSSGLAAVSQATFSLLSQLGLAISGEMATNLLIGIESATDGLQSLSATAETFESVAQLLRLGARRVRRPSSTTNVVKPKTEQTQIKSTSGEGFAQVLNQKVTETATKSKPKLKSKKKGTIKMGGLDHQPGIGTMSK